MLMYEVEYMKTTYRLIALLGELNGFKDVAKYSTYT
jgi:hypothetical protein